MLLFHKSKRLQIQLMSLIFNSDSPALLNTIIHNVSYQVVNAIVQILGAGN